MSGYGRDDRTMIMARATVAAQPGCPETRRGRLGRSRAPRWRGGRFGLAAILGAFRALVAPALLIVLGTLGCATAPPADCPPCVPEIRVERYPLPMILPWPAPECLPALVLPAYPEKPTDPAEEGPWAFAVVRTAQDREAIQARRIETLAAQLDVYRQTPALPPDDQ